MDHLLDQHAAVERANNANRNRPLVSIGLPVYNGERYLEEAITSILDQTHEHLELIISDNASTDATGDICRKYAAMDPRVRYFRNSTNVGAAKNFNTTFELSKGKYFKWAAADDLCAPEFIEKCVEVLEQEPEVILAYPKARRIDETGGFHTSEMAVLNTSSRTPHVRFRELVCRSHPCFAVFGVFRRAALEGTALIAAYVGSDRILLAGLSLYGRFHEVPDYLFFRREHPHTSQRDYPSYQERIRWYDPTLHNRITLPYWKMLSEYCKAIHHAPLNHLERSKCYMHMARWIVTPENTWWMAFDLGMAVILLITRFPRMSGRCGYQHDAPCIPDIPETRMQAKDHDDPTASHPDICMK